MDRWMPMRRGPIPSRRSTRIRELLPLRDVPQTIRRSFRRICPIPEDDFEWTNGKPAHYQSSDGVIRRFCGACGSALTFEASGVFFVTLGSLDRSERVAFKCHTYTESRFPGITLSDGLPQIPGPAGSKGGRTIA